MKLTNIALIRTARTGRFSSWDVSGRNADYWTIPAKSSRVLADIQGPGVITHIWMTQYINYRNAVLKITWDDAPAPSVLCPLGDFFGLGHAIVNSYQSLLFSASVRGGANNSCEFDPSQGPPPFHKGDRIAGCALNCYAPMPFRKRAVLELLNESDADHTQYFYIDYEQMPENELAGLGYFHAEFRRACPFLGWAPDITVNTLPVNIPNLERAAWANNYVILETKGRGHYLGCNLSVTNIQGTWWGEGDDMIWVDGYQWPPDLHGTGSEDYLNQAWGMQPNTFLRNGSSIHESNTGGYQTSYVHHLENPVRFEKEIKVTIEHGHANHLGNEMASVAYWYTETPAAAIAIPPMEKRRRVPKVNGKFVISDELRWPGQEVKVDEAVVKEARAAWEAIQTQPGSPAEPVRYTGNEDVDLTQPDGGLRAVVGAQNYQVLRTFRHNPAASDGLGWTYHHEPMLTYWKNRFYLICKTDPADEDADQGCVLLFTSDDEGRTWSSSIVLFPACEVAPGDWTFNGTRLGFWIAPSGRLYAMADYIPLSGYNTGDYCNWLTFGVTVREIREDGVFGPIHFVADNPTLHPRHTLPFPYYTTSADAAFKADCEALRADKIATLSWWEAIRPENFTYPKDLVDFIAKKGDNRFAKAPCVYRRADGALVALWKMSWASLSLDEGATWSEPVQLQTMGAGYDKIWGQRTADGRFACSWTPRASTAVGNRLPLIVAVGDDGILFSGEMLSVNGEAYRRYEGRYKDFGPSNYQRGLVEGYSETPPGTDLWLAYSMSKEDIWFSRLPLPLLGAVDSHVHDTFNDMQTGGVVREWNIYSPRYAPVRVVEFPSATDKSLELRDMDSFDYAKAERVFPESRAVQITFRLLAKQTTGRLEIDVRSQTPGRYRPVQLWLDANGHIKTPHGILASYRSDIWHLMTVDIDTSKQAYRVAVDGKEASGWLPFVLPPYYERRTPELPLVASVERLVFRTGPYRGIDMRAIEPAVDRPIPAMVFYVNEVTTSNKI